jgi:hypothetical protein
MKTVATCALLYLLILCFAGCYRSEDDVLTYTRQLRPGMTPDEVKSTFPKEMQCMDEPVDESRQLCWMARCYSTNLVTRRLRFDEVKSFRAAQVYFDSDGKLVGINIIGMSGGFLKSDELRFPGGTAFPIGIRWRPIGVSGTLPSSHARFGYEPALNNHANQDRLNSRWRHFDNSVHSVNKSRPVFPRN